MIVNPTIMRIYPFPFFSICSKFITTKIIVIFELKNKKQIKIKGTNSSYLLIRNT